MEEQKLVLKDGLSMGKMPDVVAMLEPLWDPFTQYERVHLDMSQVTFVWPCVITLLTTAVIRLRREGISVDITQPRSRDADDYLNRIDFYELAGMDVHYPWQRHNSAGRFREVVQVQSEHEGEEVVREVMAILDQNMDGIAGVYDAVRHSFLEIVSNVFHHAQSPTQAVVCAQSYSGLGCVELAVADSGRGIPASLGQNPELADRFSNAAQGIALAVEPRTTGRPEYNSGEGLFFSLEFVKSNGGEACIHSQDGALWVEEGQTEAETTSFWPGTCVSMRFRTDQPVDVEAVFDRHAPPENDYDWLF
jgi:hypothetical protein